MDALTYIATKYGLQLNARSPIEIRNTNRDTLARLFHVLGFTRGAEVGVERGMYSEVLCRENPGVELFAVDAWQHYRQYRDHVNQGKLDRFYEETRERLAPYRATLIRKFSVEAAKDFKDGSLDFVYLDGNHSLPFVIADLHAWAPKVREGGIVAGHDFAPHKYPDVIHVVQAVQAWVDAYDIHPWFLLGTKAEVPGELRDKARSWFWVNTPRPLVFRDGRPVRQ